MQDEPSQPSELRYCIDLAYVEDGCLFAFGWLVGEVVAVGTQGGSATAGLFRFPRLDVAEIVGGGAAGEHGFGLVVPFVVPDETGAVALRFALADGREFALSIRPSSERDSFRQHVTATAAALDGVLAAFEPEAEERLRRVSRLYRLGSAGIAEPLVDIVCIGAPGCLVVIGRGLDPAARRIGLATTAGLGTLIALPDGGEDRFVGVVALSGPVMLDEAAVLVLAGAGGVWRGTLGPLGRIEQGFAKLPRLLAGLSPDMRLAIVEALGAALPRSALSEADAARFAGLREAAIGDLPDNLDQPELSLRMIVDAAHRVGCEGVFLVGWALLSTGLVAGVDCVIAGQAAPLSRDWVLHPRPDVWQALKRDGALLPDDALGYACFVPMTLPGEAVAGYLAVRLVSGAARRMRIELGRPKDDPLETIRQLLTAFHQTHRNLRLLLDRHIGPAVQTAWRRRLPPPAAQVTAFGTPPAAPEASLVVPIYGRFDFIEHQLAAFVDDPLLRASDIVYVVDDPAIYDQVRLACIDLAGFYDVPFRLVYGGRNAGFAQASNLGASLARGRYLLLLNSDVLPKAPGWLDALLAAHRALPDAGCVAPKLLYEDESIQHAGMRFFRLPSWDGLWVNDHPLKGQPNRPGGEPEAFLALTGACLLLTRETFEAVGGFSEDYVIGDFEDSDLCLKLVERGLRNWLVPSVELYHLERQSQKLIGSSEWRANLSLYNCWLHSGRWEATIARHLAGAA